jgi:hypothetical protein
MEALVVAGIVALLVVSAFALRSDFRVFVILGLGALGAATGARTVGEESLSNLLAAIGFLELVLAVCLATRTLSREAVSVTREPNEEESFAETHQAERKRTRARS